MSIKINSIYIYFLFFIVSSFVAKSFGYTMIDDGWRHIAMAMNQDIMISWENVYLHSLYGSFDPWFVWHNILYFIAQFSGQYNVHIVVNTFVYFALSLWFYNVFKKYSDIPQLLSVILSMGLPLLFSRYFIVRPDLLSGLFVLYLVLISRKTVILIVSIIYAPLYYVFWFYFGYLIGVFIVLKEYKKILIFFIAFVVGIIFYCNVDCEGFMHITQLVLNNDSLLEGHFVTESQPYFIPMYIKNYLGSTVLLAILFMISVLLYLRFKPKTLLIKYFIFLLPLIFLQYRFFNLFAPLILSIMIIYGYRVYVYIQLNGLIKTKNIIEVFLKENTYVYNLNKFSVNILAMITIIVLLGINFIEKKKNYNVLENHLNSLDFLNDQPYKNKNILITKMDINIYLALYQNPTAKYLPSFSLGWVDYKDDDRKIYFNIANGKMYDDEVRFFDFLASNNIDYILIPTKNNQYILTSQTLEKYGYKFERLTAYLIVFKRVT